MREYALRLGIDLGSALSQDEERLLCEIGVVKTYDRGAELALQDEPADYIHLLQTGAVKTYQTDAAGRASVLRIHLIGSVIGLSSLTSRKRWDATSVALKPSRTIMVRRSCFVDLLAETPELSLKLIRLLVDRLSDLHFRLGEMQSRSVEQRLAYVLMSLSRPDSDRNVNTESESIYLTHEELSQMINSRRQTVTSVIARFASDGLVANSLRHVSVLDRDRLRTRLRDSSRVTS